MKKNLLKILSLLMIVSLMGATLMGTLVGCTGNENTPSDPIVDDLPLGDDGKFDVTLLENVQLNLWSVIGQPDQ